jgi:hypothetical protein
VLALFWTLATASLAPAADEPRIELDGSGRVTVSSLPAILDDDEVERHLDSGLTTSFAFRARLPGPVKDGAARVDIRYELWNEVYLVTVIDGAGELDESKHESREKLAAWWSSVEILLAAMASSSNAEGNEASSPPGNGLGAQVRLSLAVVPFSQAELVDTQRWLTESIGQAQGGARAGRGGGASQAVGALIATSMQRRAIRSMSWSLPIVRRTQP